MANCYYFKKLINQLIDDEISPSEKTELDSHLSTCSECSTYLIKLKKMSKMFTRLPEVKTSEDFYVLLRARIRRELNRSGKKFYHSTSYPKHLYQFGFSTAAVILFLLLINPFNVIRKDSETQVTRSQKTGDEYNGQIQYVIDGYPTSVSLSRDDTIDSLIQHNDSLYQFDKNNAISSHVTPVNF